MFTKEELTAMGDICVKHGVTVVSDEIHNDFVFRGEHTVSATQSGRTSAGFPLLFAKSYFKQSVPRRSTISSKFKFLSAMPKSSPLFAFLILFQTLKYFR